MQVAVKPLCPTCKGVRERWEQVVCDACLTSYVNAKPHHTRKPRPCIIAYSTSRGVYCAHHKRQIMAASLDAYAAYRQHSITTCKEPA